MRIGAHVDQADPVTEAVVRKADLSQFFLGDPQGWKGPEIAYAGGAAALRSAAGDAGIDLYVHAPYVLNVATTNNRIRIPSRKFLQQYVDAATEIGAKALIVHGGHVLRDDDPAIGFDNWRKTFERTELRCPVLIENTAGGDNAMARTFDALARLWEAIGDFDAGFCLDTCHAHAAGEDLAGIVDRVKAITGRIDLVHANNSKDPFGSSRDRHENMSKGEIDPELIAAVAAAAGTPVVVETPMDGHVADIEFIRSRVDD
jgi:deoxyribonuclease IV